MSPGPGAARDTPGVLLPSDFDPPHTAGTVTLEVRLLEASRAFEVSDNGNLIVSGEQGQGAVMAAPAPEAGNGPQDGS